MRYNAAYAVSGISGDGRKIDVALERHGEVIACEISILTPVDKEVGNAEKCLKAGCRHIAMICPDPTKLAKIQKAVAGCLPAEDLKRVGYYSPEEFLVFLKGLKPPEPHATEAEPKQRGKYTVKRLSAAHSPEEIRSREAVAHRVLAEQMRTKP